MNTFGRVVWAAVWLFVVVVLVGLCVAGVGWLGWWLEGWGGSLMCGV